MPTPTFLSTYEILIAWAYTVKCYFSFATSLYEKGLIDLFIIIILGIMNIYKNNLNAN